MERSDRRGPRSSGGRSAAYDGAVVLLEDPFHRYATDLIEHVHRKYGIRSVVYYTDADEMRFLAPDHPTLRGPAIAASYVVGRDEIRDFVPVLRERHDVRAVLPHAEPTVAGLAQIAEQLGLGWAQPGVIERFRDKHALKAHLRSVPGAPRINAVARVRTRAEIEAAYSTGEFGRFVLKPNDGFGNSLIGFFDADDLGRPLDDYLTELGGRQLVMEDYIGGVEYFANGQIDGRGAVTVTEVTRAVRGEFNGRENVSLGYLSVRTGDPVFATIVDYVTALMTATGLRRSPFHLELKVDDRGPCLIEVAARHCGNLHVYDTDEMHGRLDSLGLSAHYYLSDDDYGDVGLDWPRYDEAIWGHVNGVSTSACRVNSLSGLEEVESWSGFVRWLDRPTIGKRMVPTVDLFQQAWLATIRVSSEQEYDERAQWMHDTVRWNLPASRPVTALRSAAALVPPVRRRLRHEWHRVVPAVRTTAWRSGSGSVAVVSP